MKSINGMICKKTNKKKTIPQQMVVKSWDVEIPQPEKRLILQWFKTEFLKYSNSQFLFYYLLQCCLVVEKNTLSFSLLQHTLSSHLPRPSASVLISFCHLSSVTIWFDAHPVCRGAAPCSPHRSPFRSSLNPADHNRAGFQGGSQSTPNTPKVRLLRRRTAVALT